MNYACDVLVYSCVTGGYDQVAKTLLSRTGISDDRVRYVLYTDQVSSVTPEAEDDPKTSFWTLRPLLWRHPLCSRRTARWHKVNSHKLDVSSLVTVWIDGSHRFKEGVNVVDDLVAQATRLTDLATFKHPERNCVYQEILACKQFRKDNPVLMDAQINRYRAEGYPAYAGMVETSCVVRKSSAAVTQFNNAWWQQIEAGSYRDQLSFNYVARKQNFLYGIVPGDRVNSPFFEYVGHN